MSMSNPIMRGVLAGLLSAIIMFAWWLQQQELDRANQQKIVMTEELQQEKVMNAQVNARLEASNKRIDQLNRTPLYKQEAASADRYTCHSHHRYEAACISDVVCPIIGVTVEQCKAMCDGADSCKAVLHNKYSQGTCYLKVKNGALVESDGQQHQSITCVKDFQDQQNIALAVVAPKSESDSASHSKALSLPQAAASPVLTTATLSEGMAASGVLAAPGHPSANRSLAFIIGEQKCGTTYLHHLLSEHSLIGSGRHPLRGTTKEQHFWNELLEKPISTAFIEFQNRFTAPIGLDSTPDYFISTIARLRLQKALKNTNAKLILVLRNPSTRAFAAWDQNKRSGWESRTFEEAMDDELQYLAKRCKSYVRMFRDPMSMRRPEERFLSWQLAVGRPPTASCLGDTCWMGYRARKFTDDSRYSTMEDGYYYEHGYRSIGEGGCRHYLPQGVYVENLRRWTQAFASNQLLIVQSEYFWAEPRKVVDQITEFLGVDPLPKTHGKHIMSKGECWHDCKTSHSPYKVPPRTYAALQRFYEPAMRNLLDDLELLEHKGFRVIPANPKVSWPNHSIDLEIDNNVHVQGDKMANRFYLRKNLLKRRTKFDATTRTASGFV